MLDEKDLQAISQLIDAKLERQTAQIDARFEQIDARFEQIDARFEQIDARFEQLDAKVDALDAKFEQQTEEIKAYIQSNNVAIGETLTVALEGMEQRLTARIDDIEAATAQNCYRLAVLDGRRKA